MKLRWGILATGKIAHSFASDLLLLQERHVIQAVASRSSDKARSFADEYSVKSFHSSYEDLIADKNVDIIYIATPHHLHEKWAIKALEANKHVLCEKPMGVNQSQTRRILETARKQNKFLMEALWSRFNPSINKALEVIKNGTIGKIKYVQSDFAFSATPDPEGRLFNPALAGGATLDIGIYPIFLSYLLLGKPKTIHTEHQFAATGVDLKVSATFTYDDIHASMYWGLDSHSPMDATISGTKGSITIHGRWHESSALSIHTDSRSKIDFPLTGRGYSYEIEACYEAIANNQLEHPKWTWKNSLELVEILDEIRSKIELSYPFE